ncbi:MAG: glycosyltransferase family 4 protein [Ignavibacteriae bacterium]|nr:glycosyltransferase family 4 protein [Ignavibacteriota bacterium]
MNELQVGLLLINGPLPPPYGGVATYLSHALPHLVQKGFRVHTVLESPQENSRHYQKYENLGVRIHYAETTRLQRLLNVIRYTGLWISLYRTARLPLGLFLQTVDSIARWLHVCETVLQRASIDIIHAYDSPWSQGFVAAYLAKKNGKKYVQTTFGEIVPHKEELVHHDQYGERYKDLVRHVLSNCDLIISVSKHCAAELNYVGITHNRVRVSYHGVDGNFFNTKYDGKEIRDRYRLGTHEVVLFLGQMRQRKGPQVLLEAIPHIVHHADNTRFLFIGPDYGMVESLNRRATELGIEQNVIWGGVVPDTDLPNIYAACDVFVFPSLTPIECLGLSMIQAMACGKPVVASRINGAPEVVSDGETGYLVEPNNPVRLAKKVTELLVQPNLRTRMGKEGRRKAESKFNQATLVEELRQLYLEVIR